MDDFLFLGIYHKDGTLTVSRRGRIFEEVACTPDMAQSIYQSTYAQCYYLRDVCHLNNWHIEDNIFNRAN